MASYGVTEITWHTPLWADVPVSYSNSWKAIFPREILEDMMRQVRGRVFTVHGINMDRIRRTNYGITYRLQTVASPDNLGILENLKQKNMRILPMGNCDFKNLGYGVNIATNRFAITNFGPYNIE